MPNGMPSWEEWNEQLSEEQRKYSLFKVLDTLSKRDCALQKTCHNRLETCGTRFQKLEKRKWFDRGVAIVSGAITGALTALGIKVGQ